VAADLRGDLLGAENRLTPLALWTGIFAGPVAWAADLLASYALVHVACARRNVAILDATTIAALIIVAGGAVTSSLALRATSDDDATDGGRPRDRARFMAVLGLLISGLFALQILAGAIPQRVLDACQ
jgi:hypothetical protein